MSVRNLTVERWDDGTYTVVRIIATGFATEADAWAAIDAHDREHAKWFDQIHSIRDAFANAGPHHG
jgi:hypothetical protein